MTRRPTGAEEDVLASQPEFANWLQEGEALRSRSDKLARQVQEAQVAQAKATADHADAVTAAVRAGQPIPETPAGVDFAPLNKAADVQRWDEQQHRDRRHVVVAEIADDVMATLRQRERSRQEQLTAIAHQLDQIESEARRDAFTVRDVFNAEDEVGHVSTHPTRADRVQVPDVTMLLAAARHHGKSLLDPAPLPPRNMEEQGMVLIDRDHVWQQHGREPDLHGLER